MGLLDSLTGGMNSPLTHAGLGLLGANEKRMAYDPAQLPRSGWGAGLLGGMNSYNKYQQQQSEQANRAGLLSAKQDELKLKQAEAQRESKLLEQQQAGFAQWVQTLEPQKQQQAVSMFRTGVPPNEIFKRFSPAPTKGPSSYEEYTRAYPNKEITYDAFLTMDANRKRPTTSVTNVMPGGGSELSTRPMTEAEARSFGLQSAEGLGVDSKGKPVKVEGGKATVDEARAVQFAAQMDESKTNLKDYEKDPTWKPGIMEYSAPSSLLGIPAKNLLGSSKYKEYYSNAARWAASYIYLVSGATARQEEVDSTVREYFRTPGDSQEQIKQKIAARAVAEKQAKARGGRFGAGSNAAPRIRYDKQGNRVQ